MKTPPPLRVPLHHGLHNSFSARYDQISNWFEDFGTCEQLALVYGLLSRMDIVRNRFLLNSNLGTCCLASDNSLQSRANDSVYINNLCCEAKSEAVREVLSCLPLLDHNFPAAKREYLAILPKILAHSIDKGCDLEESRELLTYSLLHPVFTCEEKAQFDVWRQYLVPALPRLPEFAPIPKQISPSLSTPTPLLSLNPTFNGSPPSYSPPHHVQAPPLMPQQQQHPPPPPQMQPSYHSNYTLPPHQQPPPSQPPSSHAAPPLSISSAQPSHNPRPHLHNRPAQPQQPQAPPQQQAPPSSLPVTMGVGFTSSSSPPYYNSPGQEDVNISNWLSNTNNGHETNSRILSPRSSMSSSCSSGEQRNSFLEDNSGMSEVPIWLKTLRLHKYASLFQLMNYPEMLSLTEQWLELQGVTKGARHKIIVNVEKLRKRSSVLDDIERELLTPLAVGRCNLRAAIGELKTMVTSTPVPHISTDYNQLAHHIIRVIAKLLSQILIGSHYDEISFNQFQQLLDKCLHHNSFTFCEKRKFQIWQQQCSYFSTNNMFLKTRPLHNNQYSIEIKNPVSRTNSAPTRSLRFINRHVPHRPASDICITDQEIDANLDSLCLRMTEHALN